MHWIDWAVMLTVLLGIVAYGMWKTRSVSSVKSYLLGDRELSWWTIGLSVMATQASAITFLSTPGQAYDDGMRFVQFYLGMPIAMILLCVFVLPIYYRLNVYTAYEYLEQRFDLIFEMDADFSHDPAHLPEFLAAIENADIVLGSRYRDGKVTVVNWPIARLLLSYGANVYARAVTGMTLGDATGGFKCFRRPVLEAIPLDDVRSNGYAFQIEMSFRAWKRNFRIAEIPIVFHDRTEGESKMSKRIIREAIWMVWRLRWWGITGRY